MVGRSARDCEDACAGSEECKVEEACVPLVMVDISAIDCAARGLNAFEDEESEWVVSGVKPFASEGARL